MSWASREVPYGRTGYRPKWRFPLAHGLGTLPNPGANDSSSAEGGRLWKVRCGHRVSPASPTAAMRLQRWRPAPIQPAGWIAFAAAPPIRDHRFVLCRGVRHTTSAMSRNLLIFRAAGNGLRLALIRVMRTLLFGRRRSNAGLHDAGRDAGEIVIGVARTSSQSTVTVTGRVTVDSSPHLRSVLLQQLHREPGPAVVVDLSGVSYLDMSGLATLLEALKAARQRSKTIRVLGLTGQSRFLAEIAELDKIFQSVGSEVEFR